MVGVGVKQKSCFSGLERSRYWLILCGILLLLIVQKGWSQEGTTKSEETGGAVAITPASSDDEASSSSVSVSQDELIEDMSLDIYQGFNDRRRRNPEAIYMVSLDGPPGSGKSTYVDKMKDSLCKIHKKLTGEQDLSVYVFGIDQLLHPREYRAEKFKHHGEGTSGNCNSDEYRWEEVYQCLTAIVEARSYDIQAYDRSTGGLKELEQRQCAGPAIVIVEGTHTSGERLNAFIDYPLFLDIDDLLAQWNRRNRDKARGMEKVLAILKVMFQEDQLGLWRAANRLASWLRVSWQPVQPLTPLSESNFEHPPPGHEDIQREMVLEGVTGSLLLGRFYRHNFVSLGEGGLRTLLLATNDSSMGRFWPALSSERKDEKGVDDDEVLRMYKKQFAEAVNKLLAVSGATLQSVTCNHDCLFNAMNGALKVKLDRDKVVSLLLRLRHRIRTGSLTEPQVRLLGWLQEDVSAELRHINGLQPGGLQTAIYIWAALLTEEFEDLEGVDVAPLVLMININGHIEAWSVGLDGVLRRLTSIPAHTVMLVYDGADEWMFTTSGDAIIILGPDSEQQVGHNDSPQHDSGFSSLNGQESLRELMKAGGVVLPGLGGGANGVLRQPLPAVKSMPKVQ